MKTYPLVALLISAISVHSYGEIYGGIEFPEGEVSFVDEVVLYEPRYSGGNIPTPFYTNAQNAIGVPDSGSGIGDYSVSLGSGGRITLRFTNNLLTGSDDDSPDLHIFEIGTAVEDTFVEISTDGTNWHSVGKVFGATSSIDIDSFGYTTTNHFSYVRLTDDPNEGPTGTDSVGADINAVGAIYTEPTYHMPELNIETAILLKFHSALGSTYTIESSTNLVSWTNAVSDIEGDGDVKKFFFEITAPETFYRLKPPEE